MFPKCVRSSKLRHPLSTSLLLSRTLALRRVHAADREGAQAHPHKDVSTQRTTSALFRAAPALHAIERADKIWWAESFPAVRRTARKRTMGTQATEAEEVEAELSARAPPSEKATTEKSPLQRYSWPPPPKKCAQDVACVHPSAQRFQGSRSLPGSRSLEALCQYCKVDKHSGDRAHLAACHAELSDLAASF